MMFPTKSARRLLLVTALLLTGVFVLYLLWLRTSHASEFRVPAEFRGDMGVFEELLADVLTDQDSGVMVTFPSSWLAEKVPGYVVADGSRELPIRSIFYPTAAWNRAIKERAAEYLTRVRLLDRVTQLPELRGACRFSLDETFGMLQLFLRECPDRTSFDTTIVIGLATEGTCPACSDGQTYDIEFRIVGEGYSLEASLTDDNVEYFEAISQALKMEIERWRVPTE